ncbi:hypothetical protein SEA_TYPHER_9 [Microbacterium phage Typher]|nr:hypothetical protein SEA_TYPHER_9 [Microbacterium phage Typher]
MRKRKNGEPQVVHRRCAAERWNRQCIHNAEPGSRYCEAHQDEEN